jgi:hypothetical protein
MVWGRWDAATGFPWPQPAVTLGVRRSPWLGISRRARTVEEPLNRKVFFWRKLNRKAECIAYQLWAWVSVKSPKKLPVQVVFYIGQYGLVFYMELLFVEMTCSRPEYRDAITRYRISGSAMSKKKQCKKRISPLKKRISHIRFRIGHRRRIVVLFMHLTPAVKLIFISAYSLCISIQFQAWFIWMLNRVTLTVCLNTSKHAHARTSQSIKNANAIIKIF